VPLSPHTRLGPYEIVSAIGAGGMGEVYQARDMRLDRTVAIKILPEHISAKPQARERFEREARAVSSLNHPHICTLHDVGHQDGIDYLVMEYLEGETLAHRLRKGPLPIEQVLQYAIQITDALDTAHKHGVIHRDLKPGNIMLTKSGAKLLDFGLAKVRTAEAVAGVTSLATQTTPLTGEGTILGTLQYMAPEQLEGREADARTDIFALGAVIYEMTTGRKAFEGKSQASLISAIMTAQPLPVSTVQSMAPPALDHVVRTCLAKDPDARWQTAHDVLVELKWLGEGSQLTVPGRPATSRNILLISWLLLAIVSLVAVTLAVILLRQPPREVYVVRYQIRLPERMRMDTFDSPVLSPDGLRVILPGVVDGIRHLWLRSLDSLVDQVLPGTEDGYFPFWSPDSRSIAFFAKDKLKRIDIAGGPAQTVCDVSFPNGGGTWNRDDIILFSGTNGSGIFRVSAAGGEPKAVFQIDKSRQEKAQIMPQFLPDGRHFLFTSESGSRAKDGIYAGSLDSQETRLLLTTESNAIYTPPGFLIYSRQETVLAQPFNAAKLKVTGDAVPIAEHVGRNPSWPISLFSGSENGALAYSSAGLNLVQLAWYDRDGSRKASVGEPGIYDGPVLSPDEKKLALARSEPSTSKVDIWILELSTGIMSRVTLSSFAGVALWSRDGRELLINKNPNGPMDLYRKEIGGGEEQLVLQTDKDKYAPQWLTDGSVIYHSENIVYRLLAGEQKPIALFKSPSDIDDPVVTKDCRWVAYQSTESGRWEIYVASFPSFKERRQVSSSGGYAPHWRKDGKELFYLGLDAKLMSVNVTDDSSIRTSAPRVLFQTAVRVDPASSNPYDVSGDGKRFLVSEPLGAANRFVTVVLNFNAGLKH